MTRDNANNYCQSTHGTTLATITNQNEQNKIIALVGSSLHYWIGYKRNPVNTNTFVWESNVVSNYGDWRSGEPNGASENCVVSSPNVGHWSDVFCTQNQGFICDDGMFLWIYRSIMI